MLPVESLNGLVTFVTAARASTFTEAARTLGLSRSAVGKSIARLEGRLGVRLFNRTTRRISLTADGEAYLAACATALDEIEAAEAGLGSQSQRPVGRLRIDMPSAFGRHVILPILLRIGAEHPDLHFTLTFSDQLLDPAEEGVDLTIRFGGLEQAGHLVARRLGRQKLATCASPGYLQAYGEPRSTQDLEKHRSIVGFRHGQAVAWQIGGTGADARFVPSGTHQFSDGDAIIEAALAGLGICQMPASLVRPHLVSGALQTVLDHCEHPEIEIHALWPRTRHLRPKVRHVVDELAKYALEGAFD